MCCLVEDSPKSIAAIAGIPPDPGLGPPWLGSQQEMGQGQALHGHVGRDAACGAAGARGWGSPSHSSPAMMSPLSFFCCSPCLRYQDLPSLASSTEMVCLHPPSMSVCPPPLLVSLRPPPPPPSPCGVPLTVCLLSPRSQDSCSQDSSTEMVGCSARLMPGFSFFWRCFSACSAPGTQIHHLPGVWVPRGAAVTKGSLVTRSALALPSWF